MKPEPAETMTSPGELRRLARVLGAILLLAAPALSFGVWNSTREPRELFERMTRQRTAGDSAAYVNVAYHASHAYATIASRWHRTGFATLGLAGVVVGVGLLAYGRTRRLG